MRLGRNRGLLPVMLCTSRLHGFAGLLAAFALALTTVSTANAQPEPSAVPTSWEFDIDVSPLRVVEVADDDGILRPYFYLTYKVRNETGRERFFAPGLELTTDQGEIIPAGRNVPRSVTLDLLQRQRNPLLLEQFGVLGELGQGEENVKEGLAVWAVNRRDIGVATVYIGGLSGETRTVRIRAVEDGEVVLREVMLRKTLMLRHHIPGEILDSRTLSQAGRELERTQTSWILRRPLATIAAPSEAASTTTGGATDGVTDGQMRGG